MNATAISETINKICVMDSMILNFRPEESIRDINKYPAIILTVDRIASFRSNDKINFDNYYETY